MITGNELQNLPYNASIRSVENYCEDILKVVADPAQAPYHGIRNLCIFNELQSFNVCSPGLPSCIAHDIFEGVVQYDMPLIIQYLVQEGIFTYSYLNEAIKHFSFCGDDARDRPPPVVCGSKKLKGHAAQNWLLLRFFPLLIAEKILAVTCNHEVWQLLLLLRSVTEFICAHRISFHQTLYLQRLIVEYLEKRQYLFPTVSLRPKHHFMYHYPWLIMKCGPPIHLWTLRMESKHSFFKQCIRSCKNFINVCQHLAEAHQLSQCCVADATRIAGVCDMGPSAISFDTSLFATEVSTAVTSVIFHEDILCSYTLSYKGTNYVRDHFVIVERKEDTLFVGHVLLCLYANSTAYVVVRLIETAVDSNLNVLSLLSTSEKVMCIAIEKLADYCPLWSYCVSGQQKIALKHAILDS
jgi:hypothetical protein